ncbi:MAG: hypothetical protein WC486_00615 [Candidatus Omnitrophota bacterium]
MGLEKVPQRIFLDTSSLNFILEHGDCIFDNIVVSDEELERRTVEDISAFNNIFSVGERAMWQIAVSPFTHSEIIKTQDAKKLHYLKGWFMDVWDYWNTILEENNDFPSFAEAERMKIEILSSGILDILPDVEDRMLICDAAAYKCDYFCTRDWRTILKHREHLISLPVKMITPTEWWNLIKPLAALWK